MSRSYKKNAIVTDTCHEAKKAASKRVRRKNKIRVNEGEDPLDTREVTNQYDVCDWKFHAYTEKQKKKFKRK